MAAALTAIAAIAEPHPGEVQAGRTVDLPRAIDRSPAWHCPEKGP